LNKQKVMSNSLKKLGIDGDYNKECSKNLDRPISVIGACVEEPEQYFVDACHFWTINDDACREAMKNLKKQENYFSAGIHHGIKPLDDIIKDIKSVFKNEEGTLRLFEIKARDTDLEYRVSSLSSHESSHEYSVSKSRFVLTKGSNLLNMSVDSNRNP